MHCLSPNQTGLTNLLNPYSVVGAAAISLTTKLPWNTDGYIPPQSQLFDHVDADLTPEPAPAIEKQSSEGDSEDEPDSDEVKSEEPVVTKSPAVVSNDTYTGAFLAVPRGEDAVAFPTILEDIELLNAITEDDSGVAVVQTAEEEVGWLDKMQAMADNLLDAGEEQDVDLSELDIDLPSSWASAEFRNGRDWWIKQNKGGLENYLDTAPFERYPLFRGVYHPNPEKSTLRQVGAFKGIVRVCETDPRVGAQLVDMRALESPQKFIIRVYVVSGRNLQPTGGGLSDPYVRIKLGTHYVNDTSSVHKQVRNGNGRKEGAEGLVKEHLRCC